MMEIISEGRRAVPSVPRGIRIITVRCSECGYTRTVVRSRWLRSRMLCPVCARAERGRIGVLHVGATVYILEDTEWPCERSGKNCFV